MEETQTETVASQATTQATPKDTTVGGGKNIVIPKSAFDERLKSATERGRRAAMAELDRQAQEHGFKTHQDMLSATAALLKGGQAPNKGSEPKKNGERKTAQQAPTRGETGEQVERTNEQNNGNRRNSWKDEQRFQRQLDRERKLAADEKRQRLHEQKRRERAEREKEALEVEMGVREQAIRSGITDPEDVDYAVGCLRSAIRGKSEKELEAFSEDQFFAQLKEKRPGIFSGVVTKPVTTGTGGAKTSSGAVEKGTAADASPPKPGEVTKKVSGEEQSDARKMDDAAYRAHLRKRGLDAPMV